MKTFRTFLTEERSNYLWKYNKRTGYWDHQRAVTPETGPQWLHHFQKDEPNEFFMISKNRPKHDPEKKRRGTK